MIYPYHCDKCNNDFEVVKHYSKSGDPEICPLCDNEARYVFTVPSLDTDCCHAEYEFNPAFGTWIKNKKHRETLAKRNGMVEIGNESLETIHKESAKTHKQIMRSYDD